MSHAKRKPRAAPANLFDKLKVEQFTLYMSPVENDPGAALVFQFEHDVDLSEDTLAFPLDGDQMMRLWRLVNGWAGQQGLLEMAQRDRLVKMPHEM